MNLTETTLSSETLLQGIVFRIDRHRVRLGDGSESWRDLLRHAGGVGVLARTPRNTFLLVRQYRKAVEQEVVEIVAGLREPGEDPAHTAARELEEETGYRAKQLQYLGKSFASPGYTDEVVHLFFAETEEAPGVLRLDHDERLRVEEIPAEELQRRLSTNELPDSKTIAACFFARNAGLI
jgi:ADP-ribose pyrophosphatase